MTELDPLSTELAELLSAARTLDKAPLASRARLIQRMELRAAAPLASNGPGGVEATAKALARKGPLSPLAQKMAIGLTCFVVGGILGALAVSALRASEAAAPAATGFGAVPTSTPPLVPAPEASVATVATSHVLNVPEPAPSARIARPVTTDTKTSDLAEERRLLDAARAALLRGEPASAMSPLTEHTRRFGQGVLAEEREALLVQVLARQGRATEAAARADRFRRVYPTSFMMPAVDDAIDSMHDN